MVRIPVLYAWARECLERRAGKRRCEQREEEIRSDRREEGVQGSRAGEMRGEESRSERTREKGRECREVWPVVDYTRTRLSGRRISIGGRSIRRPDVEES